MQRIFQDPYIQEGWFQPLQCNSHIRDCVENNLCIQMLDKMMVQAGNSNNHGIGDVSVNLFSMTECRLSL